jgi:pimeloyl-ACP methyl ester carboxylesterase
MGWSVPAAQQATPRPAAATSDFTIFLRSIPVGTEQISVTQTDAGWTITSAGRIGAPVDATTERLQLRYDPQWRPLELTMNASLRGEPLTVHTVVTGTSARSELSTGGTPVEVTRTLEEAAALLTNPFFAAYEAISAQVANAPAGTTSQVYLAPYEPIRLTVGSSSPETIQTVERVISARRTTVTFSSTGRPNETLEIWSDETGRLLRVSIPHESIEAVREDIASVSTRRVTVSRANDEPVRIPAVGFTLAGTLSKPVEAAAPGQRWPAIVLVGGAGSADRDETVANIPIFGQLAGALADAGFLVLRYDRRGVGQSGGRPEAATIVDYADDLRAAVRLMSDRRDVDRRRLAVVAYGEGGPIGMSAAARDDRIRALVLVAAPGMAGTDLNMAQAARSVSRSNQSDAEKQATLDLQKRIQSAVLTGNGWETIPPAFRQRADSPWFQSFLLFDPAKVMPDIEQPLLVVHGSLDSEIDPANADRLDTLARARRRRPPVEIARLAGVNHLLVAATTGEADEYARLSAAQVSPEVGQTIAQWLLKTLPAAAR